MLAPLVLLFILVPILELYVIIQVGQEIGALWTIAILVADSILGSLLLRAQGRSAWRRFNAALSAGRPPAREVLDGVLIVFGGALLLTPGFATDVAGLLLLIPPTRAVIRRVLVRRLAKRVVVATPPRPPGGRVPPPGGERSSARPPGSGAGDDIEGTATEVDPRALR
jgi:UPF0716 protein FxsA